MKMAISIDCGGSMTKIIYRLWKSSKDKVTSYIWMSPLVEEVTTEKIKEYFEYKGWVGAPNPENQAYLKVDERNFVLGEFATQFRAKDRIFQVKYENAIYKVLAGIGVVLQKNGVETKKALPSWISVLLPWDEYTDRTRFSNKLLDLLGSYKFRNQTIKVRANKDSICVRPEGGGIFTSVMYHKPDLFKAKRIGIGMFGHRNITGFFVEDGQIHKGQSPQIGLVKMLDDVVEMTSGLDRHDVLNGINGAIKKGKSSRRTKDVISTKRRDQWNDTRKIEYYLAKTGTPNWSECSSIKSLASASSPDLRELEVKDISRAIDIALREYRNQIKNWLNETFSNNLDYFIFSGGAVNLLLPVLEDYCESYRRVHTTENEYGYSYLNELTAKYGEYEGTTWSWEKSCTLISDRQLALTVEKVLDITYREKEELSLDTRFVDNYGMFEYLLEEQRQHELRQKEAAKAKAKANGQVLPTTEADNGVSVGTVSAPVTRA